MAFIKAFTGALGGSFANQWLDYLAPPSSMTSNTLIARAVTKNNDENRTSNTKGNENIISDGSKILVPEGTCLITVENGGITGVIAEPGGYTYSAQESPEAKSMFAGDGFFASTFGQSFQQFKFGGQPGNQQFAFYINLKEIIGLPFGSQSPIPYEDAKYDMNMFEVVCNGTYGIKVVDPVLLFKNFVPIDIASGQGRGQMDLGGGSENNDEKEEQLFTDFIGCFGDAISQYTNSTGGSINTIKANATKFVENLDKTIEEKFHWETRFGLKISTVAIRDLNWTEDSREMVMTLNKKRMENAGEADLAQRMAQGNNANVYAQTQMAQGFKAMGTNANGGQVGGLDMMGAAMAMNMMNNMNGNMMAQQQIQQPQQPQQPAPQQPAAPAPEAPENPAAPETPAVDNQPAEQQ